MRDCNQLELDNLRLLLGVRGMSLADLARAMRVPSPNVSAMLSGVDGRATGTMIARAAMALGVDVGVLRDPRLRGRVLRACRLQSVDSAGLSD